MKRISAVVCELNPAHEGHKYIFSRASEFGDVVVAIMSGNFVQRGENAIYDKYRRAESALDLGADLVLELPFPWSCASAQYFSAASVSIAESIGCTDLVFGSECGDLDALRAAADVMSEEQFNSIIPGCERAAEYREQLLHTVLPGLPENILSSANDILGIEYIRNLAGVKPHPIKRISCHSASSIRESMKLDSQIHENAVFYNSLADVIYMNLRCKQSPDFITAESVGGVGMRLYKAAMSSLNGEEMLVNAATKQYTNARLKRCGLFYITDVMKEDLEKKPLFTNVLAFNEKGRDYLSSLRKNCQIELLTKPSSYKELNDDALKQAEKNMFADTIYAMISQRNADFFVKHNPIIK